MIPKNITVNYGVTVNTGVKFEFLRLDYAIEAVIQDDESPQEVFKRLREGLREEVKAAVKEELNYMEGGRPTVRR